MGNKNCNLNFKNSEKHFYYLCLSIYIKGYPLVPEHIETRSLYHPDNPGMVYGKIEMWIDLFPIKNKDSNLPAPVNIELRKPLKFQLRVIILNTENVILDDLNPLTGERTSDIYIRGFMNEQTKAQKTDVHYRSLSGEGRFNWRFIFDFEYLPAEKLILVEKSTKFGFKTELVKEKPVLTLECWDADVVTKDDKLGVLKIKLTEVPKCAHSASACVLSTFKKNQRPTINLFETPKLKGWWPFSSADGKLAVR